MLPFVHIAPGVDYSTDFDFFCKEQVAVFSTQEGTSINSRLEQRAFMRTETRHISDGMIRKLCRHIHREICSLKFGGELTE